MSRSVGVSAAAMCLSVAVVMRCFRGDQVPGGPGGGCVHPADVGECSLERGRQTTSGNINFFSLKPF